MCRFARNDSIVRYSLCWSERAPGVTPWPTNWRVNTSGRPRSTLHVSVPLLCRRDGPHAPTITLMHSRCPLSQISRVWRVIFYTFFPSNGTFKILTNKNRLVHIDLTLKYHCLKLSELVKHLSYVRTVRGNVGKRGHRGSLVVHVR